MYQSFVLPVQTHLKSNGYHVTSLKQELDLLKSVVTTDSLTWVRDAVVDLLTSMWSWEQGIETSLEKCGVNVKLSNDGKSRIMSEASIIKFIFYSRLHFKITNIANLEI